MFCFLLDWFFPVCEWKFYFWMKFYSLWPPLLGPPPVVLLTLPERPVSFSKLLNRCFSSTRNCSAALECSMELGTLDGICCFDPLCSNPFPFFFCV